MSAAGRSPRVAIIGAGLGGLAAAIRLIAAGCEVTVIEAQTSTGGRAGQIRDAGFVFDTGPTLITLPELVDELFKLAGSSMHGELRMHSLDPFYRIAWEDDPRVFYFNGNRKAMRHEIGKFSAIDAHRRRPARARPAIFGSRWRTTVSSILAACGRALSGSVSSPTPCLRSISLTSRRARRSSAGDSVRPCSSRP